MNDELDLYISRQLKNWAARHPVPKDGRKRLLRAAAFSRGVREQEQSRSLSLVDVVIRFLAPQTHDYKFMYPLNELTLKPFAQSQMWSAEISPIWRFAG